MSDGVAILNKNHHPFALLKFDYMGDVFWDSFPQQEIIQKVERQFGISFYWISKQYMREMMIYRNNEFTKDDFELLSETDEVWLVKNL